MHLEPVKPTSSKTERQKLQLPLQAPRSITILRTSNIQTNNYITIMTARDVPLEFLILYVRFSTCKLELKQSYHLLRKFMINAFYGITVWSILRTTLVIDWRYFCGLNETLPRLWTWFLIFLDWNLLTRTRLSLLPLICPSFSWKIQRRLQLNETVRDSSDSTDSTILTVYELFRGETKESTSRPVLAVRDFGVQISPLSKT